MRWSVYKKKFLNLSNVYKRLQNDCRSRPEYADKRAIEFVRVKNIEWSAKPNREIEFFAQMKDNRIDFIKMHNYFRINLFSFNFNKYIFLH